MITVREMLKIEGLRNLIVVAGQGGLDRIVSTVSVMDALDIYKWMKGGEFLITSGRPVQENPSELCELIKRLDKHGASAFGIKTYRLVGTIPEEVIEIANELNFPLIFIPYEYAFTDIINPVLNEVVNKQAIELKFSEEIHEAFTKLALNEEKLEKIIETLGSIIKRDVAFYDIQHSEIVFASKEGELYKELSDIEITSESYLDFQDKYDTYVISNPRTTYGIIILGGELSIGLKNQNIALQHGGTVIILYIQKRISNNQIASKFRDEFIHDIIYNNINSELELHNRANLYNWNFDNGGIVVIIDIDNFKRNYIKGIDKEKNYHLENSMNMLYKSTVQILKSQFEQVVYSKLNDYFVFIISESKNKTGINKKMEKVFNDIKMDIKYKMNLTVTIAIGQYKSNSMKLHESYEEARKCIIISHNLNQDNQIIFYDKLGIYKLINLVTASEEADELVDRYVNKLVEYDKETNSNLLETLISICENSWNLKQASESLFVHYNTVKYRYKKICSILNTDFSTMDDRITVEIAIRIYQIALQG